MMWCQNFPTQSLRGLRNFSCGRQPGIFDACGWLQVHGKASARFAAPAHKADAGLLAAGLPDTSLATSIPPPPPPIIGVFERDKLRRGKGVHGGTGVRQESTAALCKLIPIPFLQELCFSRGCPFPANPGSWSIPSRLCLMILWRHCVWERAPWR